MSGALRQRLSHLRAAVLGPRGGPVNVRFAGAGYSRLMQGWGAYLQSIDDALLYKLGTLRARSRQLCEDNGEAAGLLLDFESDIVGPAGARLQFRAKRPRGAPLDRLNDRMEAAFTLWGKRGTCTRDGHDDWASLQRLIVRTVVMDGEFFAIRHRDPALAHGYSLQPIDADQVDAEYNVRASAEGVSVVMGVEQDRYGRPLAYHIWQGHPGSVATRGARQRIAAEDVLHVFKRVRVGQTRGIPWFAPALVTWKLGDQYTESELVQSMLAAAQGGFFVNKTGDALPTPMRRDPATGKDEPVAIEMQAEPGVGRALPPGWEFQDWKPMHPTANYVGFMKAVKRVIARAFGRSYASLTGDLSDVNFSSMRTDRVREMESNKLLQQDLLVRQTADVVFADWLTMASLTGVLGVLPAAPVDLLVSATWMCRGWPWIDPVKDLVAAELEIKHGLKSRQQICAERGVDFFDVIDQLAEEAAYAETAGVTLGDADAAVEASTTDNDDDETALTTGRTRPPLRVIAA